MKREKLYYYFVRSTLLITLVTLIVSHSKAQKDSQVKVMLLTGVATKYHSWQLTSDAIKRHLDAAKIFDTEVVICPEAPAEKAQFTVDWEEYDVVVLIYDDGNWSKPEEMQGEWSEETKAAFEKYMRKGGGLVVQHATNNGFPEWDAYNEMIGLGGWAGRTEASGPTVVWRDGKAIRKFDGGNPRHPPKQDFPVITRGPDHPIMKGFPEKWMHPYDEIYTHMRGPAKNLKVLATAYSDSSMKGGSGEHEAVVTTIKYGKGRVFNTTLGHVGLKDEAPIAAVECVGFATLIQRGTEWAATGKVTIPIPNNFPSADQFSTHQMEYAGQGK